MKCDGCMKSIRDSNSVRCTSTTCEKSFCMLCINAASLPVERRKQWKCPDCSAAQRKGGDNTLTPVRGGGSENVTTCKKTDSTGSEMSQLTEQLRQLTTEFSSVKARLEDLTVSLSFANDQMNEVMLKIASTDERLKCLEKRDSEVESLQVTVLQLQNEINSQAQAHLQNEIEIVGVPEYTAENLNHILLVAAKKMGVQLEDSDLDWVTRVGPRRPPVTTALPEDGARMPRPIVVRLLRRSKRNQFLGAVKSRRNISSTDLEVAGVPRKVFFNERLTKENRVLFRDTRFRAKEHGYAFCWCSHGIIYVRQRDGKSAMPIRSHKDLDRLLPSNAHDIVS